MPKEITLSSLRANIYQIFDEILLSGRPLVVLRNGKRIRIEAEEKVGRLAKLKKRKFIKGDSGKLDKISWNWKPTDDLS